MMNRLVKIGVITAALAVACVAQVREQNWNVFGYDFGTTTPTSCVQPGFFLNTTAANMFFCNLVTGTFQNIPVTMNSTGTLTIPAGVILTGPASSGTVATIGVPQVLCGATCTATGGSLIMLNATGGSVATLPTSTGSGNTVRLRTLVAVASGVAKVLLTTTSDTIIGTAIGENGGTAKVFVGNAGTYHSIQMPFAGTQPSGGFVGDSISCTDVAAGTWACDMLYQAGTTPTTPYSTSTT